MISLVCPLCGKTVEYSKEEVEQIKKKGKIFLKCCDQYLSKTKCPNCHEQLWLTEEEVEKAMDGQEVECPKCQSSFVPKDYYVGQVDLALEGTIGYKLCPVFGWEEERAYLDRITNLGNFPLFEVALYHVSSMTRLWTAQQSLEELDRLDLPSPIKLFFGEALNVDFGPSGENANRTLEALLFAIVSNLSSFLDMLAQEINYIIWVLGLMVAFDPIKEVKKIDFDSLSSKIGSQHKIGPFLAQVNKLWERDYLRQLRNTLQHRFLPYKTLLIFFPMRKILHPRPQIIPPEKVRYFLPDEPCQPPVNFTFEQNLEVKDTIHRLYKFCEDMAKKVYGSLP